MSKMNVINFVEEFTQLIVRWTSPKSQNESNEENVNAPLTNDQVLASVQNVLRIILGVSLPPEDYSSVKTPATGIEVCTPNAPVVAKPNELQSANLSRFRSLDTLTMGIPASDRPKFPGIESSISKSAEKIKVTNDPSSIEKKNESESSPRIRINSVSRQDTFVREDEDKAIKESDTSTEEKFESGDKIDFNSFGESEKAIPSGLLKKLEALRDCAFEVMSRIDDVKMQTRPQSTQPIRRLSSIGGFGPLSRSSTMLRPMPPPKLRRSSTTFPGTPTSSKLSTTLTGEKDDIASRRKSMTGAALHLSAAAKISPATPRPSLVLSSEKKSPLSCGRPAKNPKYAHVQSTIPKLVVGKRKAQ